MESIAQMRHASKFHARSSTTPSESPIHTPTPTRSIITFFLDILHKTARMMKKSDM